MAHSLPSERSLPAQQRRGALALPRLGAVAPWPPLLLALLTLLALVLAYMERPVVQIDMGAYYDSAYLGNFHARELSPNGPPQMWDWPDDVNELRIPGNRSGDWMVTLRANEELPGRPVSGVALLVNDVPVNIPRDSSHEFTAFLPADLVAADELVLRLRPALTGGPTPKIGIIEQAILHPARTYRWTRAESSIALPGLGRGAWQLDLDVVTAHPNDQPTNARVSVNGHTLATLPEHSELRRVRLLVPPDVTGSGSLHVTLQANTYTDPRPLGVLVAGAEVAPLASSSPLPPWSTALTSLVVVLGTYACLAVLLSGVGNTPAPRPLRLWLAALLPLALLALGGWALAAHRYPTSFMLPGLALLTLWSLLLLAALRPLLRRLLGTHNDAPLAGRWSLADALLLIFFLSYWLKVAGMLYPYFISIDIHWHMERVRWILGGQLPLLYGTDSPLNESTMPVAEWGADRPVIPYSPYFHMFATVFALLPWPLEFSANMFSALVDTSRILLIALLALGAGLSRRGALLAAALLAVLPLNMLLHSWGNLPTTFGLWLAFAATTFTVLFWDRLRQRGPFVALAGLLLAAFLIYTVAGAFTGLFLLAFTAALWLAVWRGEPQQRGLLAGLRPLWLAATVAMGIALLVYYGQYLPPIIQQTLPYFARALTESHEETGRVGDTLGAYLLRHGRLTAYGLVLPLLLTLAYLVWQWGARFRLAPAAESDEPPMRGGPLLLWAAVAAWVAVMLLFVPLGYKISMVDKHFFVAVPLMLVASAAILDALWRRFWAARAATVLYIGYLTFAAVSLWLTRIVSVRQVYE
jgi:hypothetical protein